MLPQQKNDLAYPAVRDKLKVPSLTFDDVSRALAGLSPDTAAIYLCECLREESQQRQRQERLGLIFSLVGLALWIAFNLQTGYIEPSQWLFLLLGPVLIILAVLLGVRRFRSLRHNALTGLTSVITRVHERESLLSLCQAAALLNGADRHWEDEIERAVRVQISRILVRLSADEVAMLPEPVRAFLLRAIADHRSPELTVAALLALGSAQDSAVAPIAEKLLQQDITDSVREAASDCLLELHRAP